MCGSACRSKQKKLTCAMSGLDRANVLAVAPDGACALNVQQNSYWLALPYRLGSTAQQYSPAKHPPSHSCATALQV